MRSDRGSLLIELLIGTALLAGGLFAVFGGLVTLTDTLGTNAARTVALTEAASTLALVRASGYDGLVVGTNTVPLAGLEAGTVTTLVSQPQANLRDVVITVTWTDGVHSRTAQLVTKVANDGLESL